MIRKIRLVEPGNRSPYRPSISNLYCYNRFIRNPSTGLITLATIAKGVVEDTLMYSESISRIDFDDVCSADLVLLSLNTFNAVRGYELADQIRGRSRAVVVLGGMHASLDWGEAAKHADYVLLGDGDESILELIAALDEGRPVDFAGVAFLRDGEPVRTGERPQPRNIDTVPDRSLCHNYAKMAGRYDTLWPQVHASRGCPHSCDYCAVVRHFGRCIRTRSPESVVEDIRQAIAFHRRRIIPRLSRCVWITDDNFPENRAWALSVLDAIIESGIQYNFSVQARYELGFDDEMLDRMRRAGFVEVALGIEFLEDESFRAFHKRSSYEEIKRAVANIRAHGIGVRGLFIVGADNHTKGVGDRIADYVIENGIHGCLIQSFFFTPGTPHFEQNRHRLIHTDWNRYDGHVVHYPANIRPHELQEEIIRASARIYSPRRLLHMLLHAKGLFKVLFVGEFFWHRNIRRELKKELPFLKSLPEPPADIAPAAASGPPERREAV